MHYKYIDMLYLGRRGGSNLTHYWLGSSKKVSDPPGRIVTNQTNNDPMTDVNVDPKPLKHITLPPTSPGGAMADTVAAFSLTRTPRSEPLVNRVALHQVHLEGAPRGAPGIHTPVQFINPADHVLVHLATSQHLSQC